MGVSQGTMGSFLEPFCGHLSVLRAAPGAGERWRERKRETESERPRGVCCHAIRHGAMGVHAPYHADRLRDHTLAGPLGGVPREQKMLKGHLPRVIYHQVY